MHIFLDEPGTFSGFERFASPSVVGALVFSDSDLVRILDKYARVRPSLPSEGGEVKGRLLTEQNFREVFELLIDEQIIFEASVIDLGAHTRAGVEENKRQLAVTITANLTDQLHANTRKGAYVLRETLEEMPLQLYAQSVCTFDIIERIIRHGTMYFSQRKPTELAKFNWIIDAKDANSRITKWEKWWSFFLMPELQRRSLKSPLLLLKTGDYTHFRYFEDSFPDYLTPHLGESLSSDRPIDLKRLLTESSRLSSQAELGLELADIATGALRKALAGNLEMEGWLRLPGLMIHRPQQYFSFLALEDIGRPAFPYSHVFRAFRFGGRSMLV